MYAVVHIGEHDVPMLAMASADLYYRQVFHEDPVELQASDKIEDPAVSIHFYSRMGFIMAKFAELKRREEMRKLNEDAFIDWLDQFDRGAFYDALGAIGSVYNGQDPALTDGKKKDDQPSAE